MARAGFKRTSDRVERSLQDAVMRGRDMSLYLAKVVFPKYKQAQIERWETLNASQGSAWIPVDPDSAYGRYKKRKFASYPGAGNKTMIATGHLFEGAREAEPPYGSHFITEKSIRTSVNLGELPYAKYPGITRPFMLFSRSQKKEWLNGAARWMMKGRE